MRRALERAGYRSSEETTLIEVGHHPNDGAGRWRLRMNSASSRHKTIQAVLEALESERP